VSERKIIIETNFLPDRETNLRQYTVYTQMHTDNNTTIQIDRQIRI